MQFRGLPVLLIIVAVGLAACDINLDDVDLIVDVADQEVTLGGESATVGVTDGQTAANTSTVPNNLEVDEIRQLKQVKLQPSFFTFAESVAAGKRLDSGTITLLISIGLPPNGPLYPIPPVTLTITNNVVTKVEPESISLLGGTYNVSQIEGLLNSLPESQRPNMASLQGLTIDQAREAIQTALANSTGFLFSIVAQSNGVSGDLTLKELSIDARVVESR